MIRKENQQNEEMKKLEETPSSSKEILELRETNDNLKTLLNNAEKKYSHLASINSELQKRIDLIEQQSQVHNDSMFIFLFFYIILLDQLICVQLIVIVILYYLLILLTRMKLLC